MGFFPELQNNLTKSGFYLPADAYISFMILIALIVGITVAANAFIMALIITSNTSFSSVVGFIGLLLGSIMSIAFAYTYPSITTSKKRRSIEEGLPYALSFMGVLSSAGVPPKRVVKAIAQLEERKMGLGGEATVMYRDMELLGGDLISVLKEGARRNISPLFSGLLEGLVSTIRTGGDLSRFFQEEANGLMRMRRSILKEFIDFLVMISELYMALMVAFPLMFIVMLVVMSSIGGGTIGGAGPEGIVPLVIYMMVPLSGMVLIFMLDSISPG